jgi:hypothetical protein
MMRDEHEEYGEDSRDIIAGLRHLAQQSEAPPELLATILGQGHQLLPRQRGVRIWWQRLLAPWQLRPLVWGPVIALVGFMAGVLVPLPHFEKSMHSSAPEKVLQAPEEPPLRSTDLAAPALPPVSQPEAQSAAPRTRDEAEKRAPHPAAPAPSRVGGVARERQDPRPGVLAFRDKLEPATPDAAPQVEVTITLPAVLYEQLVHEAAQRHTDLSTVLREAIEMYRERRK